MIKINNPQKRIFITWIVITIISFFLAIISLMDFIDINEGGGALIFVGFIMGISGLIVIALYYQRVKIVNDMIYEKDLLAHWEYSGDYWIKFANIDYKQTKSEKFKLLRLVGIICIVVLVFLTVITPDGFIIFLIAMSSLMLILTITVLAVNYKHKKRNFVNKGVVLISKRGAYINGEVHTWAGFSTKFENIEYVVSEPDYLQFQYSASTKQGRQTYTFRVPVPIDKENEVKKVLHYFNTL